MMELTPEQIKNYHRIIPDPEEQDRCCIFIELGPFAGITVAFGRFQMADKDNDDGTTKDVSYTHLRAHETREEIGLRVGR